MAGKKLLELRLPQILEVVAVAVEQEDQPMQAALAAAA
jgi:hypothetical protein